MNSELSSDTNSQTESSVRCSCCQNILPPLSPPSIITPDSNISENLNSNIDLYNTCNHLIGVEYSHLSAMLRVYAWIILFASLIISSYISFKYPFLNTSSPNTIIPMPLLISALFFLQGIIIFIFSLLLGFIFKSFRLRLREAGNFVVGAIIEILKYPSVEKGKDLNPFG